MPRETAGNSTIVPPVRASVRELCREMREVGSIHGTVLPHVRWVDDPLSLESNEVFLRVVRRVRERVCTASRAPCNDVTDHWLLSVPEGMRSRERDVVNYLSMVVAIDFRHWAEEDTPSETAAEVPRVIGFYAVAPSVSSPVEREALHAETPSAPPETTQEERPVMLRGSAAMVFLLRRAAEQDGLRWYDPAFLALFHGDVAAARDALAPCFLGVREDGQTPLWMPGTEERVSLLLSIGDALSTKRASFFDLFCACGGNLFGEAGFVQQLVDLHPRYWDWVPHPLRPEKRMPIMKLAQLTALALDSALPALWRWRSGQRGAERCGDVDPPRPAWLQERVNAVVAPAAAAGSTGATGPSVFLDAEELSVCCDYQIPKALRDAGLLVYDAHLASLVDGGYVLGVGSPEEVSLRVGTLVAVECLLAYLQRRLEPELQGGKVPVPLLDYALWYVGRYSTADSGAPAPSSRHHLCLTIMY